MDLLRVSAELFGEPLPRSHIGLLAAWLDRKVRQFVSRISANVSVPGAWHSGRRDQCQGPLPGTQFPVPSTQCPAPDTWCSVPSARCPQLRAQSVWDLIPSAWWSVPGDLCLMFSICLVPVFSARYCCPVPAVLGPGIKWPVPGSQCLVSGARCMIPSYKVSWAWYSVSSV